MKSANWWLHSCLVAALVCLLCGCGAMASTTATQSNPTSTPLKRAPSPTSPTQPTSHPIISDPVRLLVPKIGVDTLVEKVGIAPNGDMATPSAHPWTEVGWYALGVRPGERGNAVVAGHLNRPGGSPAVFWHLRDLQAGDPVTIKDRHGKTLHFRVTHLASYPPQSAPLQEIFGESNRASLNLITCAGDWLPSEQQTALRLVVYTSLIR